MPVSSRTSRATPVLGGLVEFEYAAGELPSAVVRAADRQESAVLTDHHSKGRRRRFGSVRKLPSGRFQARYRGPDGLMRTADATFATQTDADR